MNGTDRQPGWFFRSWIAQYLLKPLVLTLPLGVLTVYFQVNQVHSDISTALPNLSKLLDSHALGIYIGTAVYVYFFTVLFGILSKRPLSKQDLTAADLLAFVKVLDGIVGSKLNRFKKSLKRDPGTPVPNGKEIFLEITQPSQQIGAIVEGVRAFFETVADHDLSFRVGLAKVSNGDLGDEWEYFAPQTSPPRIPFEKLKSPDTTLMNCLKTKSITIVEDAKTEIKKKNGKKFLPLSDDASHDDCSLLCYPIIDHFSSSKLIYILSISVDKSGYFQKKKKKIYKHFIDEFALRLSLEHHLDLLRQMVEQQGETP